jgi:hypothetical protein
MHKEIPVKIVHVTFRTSADEASWNDVSSVESTPIIEVLPMHEPARTLSFAATAFLLDNEPLWKTPDADSQIGVSGIIRVGRRRIETRRGDPRHDTELAHKAGFGDLLEVACAGP